MDQHLIAIDLDGTTLNNRSKLTAETINTLRSAAKDGHIDIQLSLLVLSPDDLTELLNTFTIKSAFKRQWSTSMVR